MLLTPRLFSRLALTFVSLAALGLAASRPTAAQELTLTLSGVTFNDGAVASGYFDFDFTNNFTDGTFGTFDMTTTNGVTDNLTGASYSPGPDGNFTSTDLAGAPYFSLFILQNSAATNTLVFTTRGSVNGPGTYTLAPGTFVQSSFGGSGEFTPDSRIITAGSLIVTAANPVPEASTTVSFGLLLALGLGGMVTAAKRKKTNVEKAGAAV